jgi:hypothetical protein
MLLLRNFGVGGPKGIGVSGYGSIGVGLELVLVFVLVLGIKRLKIRLAGLPRELQAAKCSIGFQPVSHTNRQTSGSSENAEQARRLFYFKLGDARACGELGTSNPEPGTRNLQRYNPPAALTALSLSLIFAPWSVNAADQQDPTARLRDMLRTTILQLRAAQTENATLQAAQADSTAKIKDLNDKLEIITKQSAEDKETADKAIDDLKAQVTDRDNQIAQLKDALAKWQDGYQKAADIANAKEAERAKLATQTILLQRKVDDRETKNAELFRIGNDILTRYERFGLGTALTSREPFVGITRVKLENLVQDYQDKLLDQKIRPGQPVGTPAPAKTEQKPAAKPSPTGPPGSQQTAKPTQTRGD